VDAGTSGPAVNRQVLGSNVQWVDGGDNLLAYQTINFDPAMQQLVNTMNPTVLRYPGGAQSDLYDWTRGLGPLSARGTNLQAVSNTPQITYMGSGELLALGATLGAAALFTVNVVNGTAAEAAAWVQQTNVTRLRDATGAVLPKVNYWEIGNEPYLPNPDGSNPNTCLVDATTYVSRVNAFAHAMRAVDPGIKIGIALANDVQNGIQVVSPGCRGFAATVLKGLTEPVDFISVHDAYLPYDPTGKDHPASDEFHAAMASTLSVQTDLANMRALLQPFPQVAGLPFALTEYNAVFSFNSSSAYYYSMASPMGALYVADTMRLLAARDDILMANSWSLSGNDHWGAIHSPTNSGGPYGRPDYEVFRLFGETLQGVRMTASVLSPTFSAPDLGFSSAASGVPLVAVFVTKATSATGSQTLRVFMINKDYTTAHTAAFSIANGGSVSAVQFSQLTAANVLESDDLPNSLVRTDAALPAATASVTLPAHSIALLTVQLAPKSP
jgi:alpha-N-arabinofuranosidase